MEQTESEQNVDYWSMTVINKSHSSIRHYFILFGLVIYALDAILSAEAENSRQKAQNYTILKRKYIHIIIFESFF